MPGNGKNGYAVESQLRRMLAALPDDQEQFTQRCHQVDDWTQLFSTAHEQGIAAVILEGARRSNFPLPRMAAEAAARTVRLNTVWHDVLCGSLRGILRELAEREIAAVPLKGPFLSTRLYEDATLRPSSDLDLLVHPKALDAAIRALKPLGYEQEGGELGRFFRNHHHHVHMTHLAHLSLELHFDAYRGFGTVLPAAPLLDRSLPCSLGGWTDARVLLPEDEFLYLAVHAASHRFQRLVWLYDLKLFTLSHPGLAWDLVAARAQEHGFSAVLSFTYTLLSDWLGVSRHGGPHLRALPETRAAAAERLMRSPLSHLANAVSDFFFCAILCDDVARVTAFATRFARIKILHEAPRRTRSLFCA